MRKQRYERDDVAFPAHAYTIGEPDVAWYALGWQTEPDEDTEWSGTENRTGRVVCVMVGDDVHHVFDPTDLVPLEREAYCGECGHDGLDRSA